MLYRLAVPMFLLLAVADIAGLSGCGTEARDEKSARKPPAPILPGSVDPDAPEEFTTTESGLKYRIRRKSEGKKPKADSMVTVHYRGWLDDGEIFDSTYGTGGSPTTVFLDSMIPGWLEGLLLIGEGGMIELEIPSNLAYGNQGLPPDIPPKATIHILAEIIKVAEKPVSPKGTGSSNPSSTGPAQPGKVDPDAPEEFTVTPSGLKFRIRRKSKGETPTAASTVKVHYHGWLDNGSVVDDSYVRGEPVEFALSGVIAGWTEGLQLVGQGGMIELEIPSGLGYGDQGRPPRIPGGATLHFTIELLEVK